MLSTSAGKSRSFVHVIQVDLHAEAACSAHLGCGAGEAAAAQVLEADLDALLADQPEEVVVGLEEHILQEGIGDLHRAAVGLLVLLSQGLGGEGDAAKAAGVGGLADEDHVVALLACAVAEPGSG